MPKTIQELLLMPGCDIIHMFSQKDTHYRPTRIVGRLDNNGDVSVDIEWDTGQETWERIQCEPAQMHTMMALAEEIYSLKNMIC